MGEIGEIKEKILLKLIHKPGLSFSELWDKSIESNKFAYHLKVLEKQGLIKKVNNKYELTLKGKQRASVVDGDTGKDKKTPILCVLIIPTKDNKVLLQERLREPMYGYWGTIAGRIEAGRNLTETLKHELYEETDLKGDFEIKGLFVVKTFEEEKLVYTHYHILAKCFNVKGRLKTEMKEGKNKWVSISEVKNLKIFPDLPKLIELSQRKGFSVLEMNRYIEDGEFKRAEVVNELRL